MKVETKFNLEQPVFFMHNNKVKVSSVRGITIELGYDKRERVDISYSLIAFNSDIVKDEKEIFATKEDLIKSL